MLAGGHTGWMDVRLPLGPLAGPLGRDLRACALRDAAAFVGVPPGPDEPAVTDDDLADLPEPARRYLHFMGVVGRRRDWSFLVRFTGRFQRPGQSWMPCDAWQFNANRPITRLFHMRIDVARIVPMTGRDAYAEGTGSMRGKVLGLVTVADGAGPEFDLGELVTYLNDALALAPSMLLDGSCTWVAVDDDTFGVTLTDRDHAVSGQVTVDERGAMVDFATEDRWCDLPDGLVRARWTTPFPDWAEVDGRPWPGPGGAVWHLPEGPLPYIEGTFDATSIVRNVLPADLLG